MKYLAAIDASFEQIFAVDQKMEVFRRAWCVAEIAEAHNMGMKTSVKFLSASSLTGQVESLRSLDVRAMQASRPEDVQEILDSISDKDLFNTHLNNIIFDSETGMLAEWRSLDGVQRMERLGTIARFLRASGGRLSVLNE